MSVTEQLELCVIVLPQAVLTRECDQTLVKRDQGVTDKVCRIRIRQWLHALIHPSSLLSPPLQAALKYERDQTLQQRDQALVDKVRAVPSALACFVITPSSCAFVLCVATGGSGP